MIVETTAFEGLLVIKPRIFQDDRGHFFESWNEDTARGAGIYYAFAQDNQSMSAKDVLRGLHFQIPPYEQGKLVRVILGSVLDVVVDLRTKQPTYGKHFKKILDCQSQTMLFIPPGFAHGFKTLEDNTIFFYKCTKVFHSKHDRVIRWNDPDLNIDWEISHPILSEKDQNAPFFGDFTSPF